MDEALNDLTLFEELNDDHEFILISQIQRALRNLDDAIKGKEYARDAIYTALSHIQKELSFAIDGDNKQSCDEA